MLKFSFFPFRRRRDLATLSAVAVLSGLAFLWFMRDAASQTTPVQIATVNTIAVAEESGDFFILNQNQTVSIYDVEGKSFQILQGPLASRAENIVASPSGKYFAVFSFGENAIFTALYTSETFITARGGNPDIGNYTLPRVGRGSAAIGRFSSDEKSLYVADSLGKKIYPINLDTKIFSEINTPSPIADVQTDLSGKLLFVLTQNPDEVLILDAESRTILQRYQIGAMPGQMLYNQKLNRLYVSSRGEDIVSVVDLAKKEVRELRVGPLPIRLTYNKASGDVFVANNGDGSIHVISPNLALTKIDLQLPAYASYPISLWYSNAANKLIALNSAGRRLYFIDPQESRIIKEEKVDGWARYVAGGQAAPLAVVHRSNSSDLLIVDPAKIEATYLPYTDAETRIFSSPQMVIGDEESGRIYVSNLDLGEIVVIDGKDLSIVARIKTGPDPQVMALNDKTKKIYVTHPAENIVTVIDASRSEYPTKVIPVSGMPYPLAINKVTNKVYVALAEAKQIAVIDGDTDTLLSIIDLGPRGNFPLLVSVNEKKNKVYVANYGGDSVMAIDGETQKMEQVITVGEKPIWVRYIPELDQIYVAVEGDKKIVNIDPNTYEIVQRFAIEASPYRIFFDETAGLVYVTHRREKNVTVFKKEGEKMEIVSEKELPFFGQLDATPYNMMWRDRKTNRFYFTSQTLNNLSVTEIRRDEQQIIQLRLIAIVSDSGAVTRFDPETGRVITVEPEAPGRVAWILAGILVFLVLVVVFMLIKKRFSPQGKSNV